MTTLKVDCHNRYFFVVGFRSLKEWLMRVPTILIIVNENKRFTSVFMFKVSIEWSTTTYFSNHDFITLDYNYSGFCYDGGELVRTMKIK